MAIDNLEEFCLYRKSGTKSNEKEDKDKLKRGLNYTAINMQQADDQSKFMDIKSNNFENYTDRKALAIEQLTAIGQYLFDFQEIITTIDKANAAAAQKASAISMSAGQDQQQEHGKEAPLERDSEDVKKLQKFIKK